jgi:hypothetical protein
MPKPPLSRNIGINCFVEKSTYRFVNNLVNNSGVLSGKRFLARGKKTAMQKEFDVKFKKDGNTWLASLLHSAEEAAAGVGATPEEALKDLFLEKDKADYQNRVDEDANTTERK